MFMAAQKIYRIILIATLIITGATAGSRSASAQTEPAAQSSPQRLRNDDSTAIEVQLHLIVAKKAADGEEEKLPASLDSVLKQLKATFSFKSYRLATTLLNRVRSGGKLSLRWVGSPLLAPSAATTATPGFNEFNVQMVKLAQDENGRDVVQMSIFNFGARIPIQIPSIASTGSVPVIQYENTGITTDISMREGEPTIVGTLNVGPAGDALIIVVSAKRPSAK
jgi:hypothetical protein